MYVPYGIFTYYFILVVVLGPPGEFLSAFGYLIKNKYRLEQLKFVSV